jgi:hypothetical protein
MHTNVFFLSPMSISEKVSNSKTFTHASYGSNRGTARNVNSTATLARLKLLVDKPPAQHSHGNEPVSFTVEGELIRSQDRPARSQSLYRLSYPTDLVDKVALENDISPGS